MCLGRSFVRPEKIRRAYTGMPKDLAQDERMPNIDYDMVEQIKITVDESTNQRLSERTNKMKELCNFSFIHHILLMVLGEQTFAQFQEHSSINYKVVVRATHKIRRGVCECVWFFG